jgi:hypothetical protein
MGIPAQASRRKIGRHLTKCIKTLMNSQTKIYEAGHRGMVGSAILRNLELKGFTNIVTRTHAELDLTNQAKVAV